MAKRGSRKPEKASTRPKRGKSGSPLATGSAKAKGGKPASGAPTGTSLSGKPTAASDLSKIQSTETRPKKAGRKSKGKVETSANPMERRTLTPAEQGQVALRAARLSVEARRREAKLKRETKAERDEIAELWAQAEALEDQAEQGFELVPEGDLFADRREEEAGASTPTTGQTDAALGEIVGGNRQEPKPPIDDTKAGAVRMAAATSGVADDIQRAVNADAAGART